MSCREAPGSQVRWAGSQTSDRVTKAERQRLPTRPSNGFQPSFPAQEATGTWVLRCGARLGRGDEARGHQPTGRSTPMSKSGAGRWRGGASSQPLETQGKTFNSESSFVLR